MNTTEAPRSPEASPNPARESSLRYLAGFSREKQRGELSQREKAAAGISIKTRVEMGDLLKSISHAEIERDSLATRRVYWEKLLQTNSFLHGNSKWRHTCLLFPLI